MKYLVLSLIDELLCIYVLDRIFHTEYIQEVLIIHDFQLNLILLLQMIERHVIAQSANTHWAIV